MDYSQIIAAQKLSEDARKHKELTEDEFYQRYGATIFETLKNWKERVFNRTGGDRKTDIKPNCRPAVEKLS